MSTLALVWVTGGLGLAALFAWVILTGPGE